MQQYYVANTKIRQCNRVVTHPPPRPRKMPPGARPLITRNLKVEGPCSCCKSTPDCFFLCHTTNKSMEFNKKKHWMALPLSKDEQCEK